MTAKPLQRIGEVRKREGVQVPRDFTWHGRERFWQRVGFMNDSELRRYINDLPAGEQVIHDGFKFIFETDKRDPLWQVLVTVIPCHGGP